MNILLVRPKPHKNTINLQSFMICEPLELEYLAAVCIKEGHNVLIVDMILEKKSLKYFLKRQSYDIVGITSYLPHVNIVKSYAKQIKEFDKSIVTVVGGVVAEVMPDIFTDKNIDSVISSDSLNAFSNLLVEIAKTKRGGETSDSVIESENNYLIDGQIPCIFPNREITEKYRSKYNYIYHEKCATIKTSYGCAYNCEFCYCSALTKHCLYKREIADVIAEIKTIKEERLFIVDDNFLFDIKRLNVFCDLLEQENIKKEFIVFGRADFIAENFEILTRLKQNGLQAVFVGLESFKQEELLNFNKKTDVEINIKAVKQLETLGINCYSGIIVGYDWQKKDFDNMINYLNGFKHPMVNIQPITPLKGTALYEKMKDLICINEADYHLWDMAHLVCAPTKMSVRRFYYNILRAYFKTSANKQSRKYIKSRYGKQVYARVKRGAIKITWQYLKLIIKG